MTKTSTVTDTTTTKTTTTRAIATFEQRKLNDAQIQKIDNLKTIAAHLWDEIDTISAPPGNSEAGRLVAISKTTLEETILWATKAVSRQ